MGLSLSVSLWAFGEVYHCGCLLAFATVGFNVDISLRTLIWLSLWEFLRVCHTRHYVGVSVWEIMVISHSGYFCHWSFLWLCPCG